MVRLAVARGSVGSEAALRLRDVAAEGGWCWLVGVRWMVVVMAEWESGPVAVRSLDSSWAASIKEIIQKKF